MPKSDLIDILLVEDNPGDVRLTEIAFRKGKIANKLHVVRDGVEGMEFLKMEGSFGDVPRPDLILLDLNLPKKTGHEVLREIKSDDDLKRIPVVVLTTSDAEADILEAYNLGGNSYITKPVDMESFMKVISALEDFWFFVIKLPPAW